MKWNKQLPEPLVEQKKQAVEQVKACMDKRLGDFKTNPLFIQAGIIDPANWPEAQEELKTYSVEMLSYLLNHFADILKLNGCVIPNAIVEWKHLKLHVRKKYADKGYTAPCG